MRFLIVCIFLGVFTTGNAQGKKVDSDTFVARFENGKSLDRDSYMITISGDTLLLSDFQDSWVLIDFWTVGCRPCIKEMPAMNDFAENHGIKNLKVIAVAVDPEMERWVRISPKRNLTFPSFHAGESTKNQVLGLNLSVREDGEKKSLYTTLPRYSLLGPGGEIVERHLTKKPSDPEFAKYVSSLMK